MITVDVMDNGESRPSAYCVRRMFGCCAQEAARALGRAAGRRPFSLESLRPMMSPLTGPLTDPLLPLFQFLLSSCVLSTRLPLLPNNSNLI